MLKKIFMGEFMKFMLLILWGRVIWISISLSLSCILGFNGMDWSRWRWVIEIRVLGWSEDVEGSSRFKGGFRLYIVYRLVLFNFFLVLEIVGYGKRSRFDVFYMMKVGILFVMLL